MEADHKFLHRDLIRSNLMLSALYLTAYEILKGSIITNIRDFYYPESTPDGRSILSKRYKDEVIKAERDMLFASCLWLLQNGAITQEDIKDIEKIRKHRNQLAHELPKLLMDKELKVEPGLFLRMRELLEKIELWWVVNVHIPTNPDFDGNEVDENTIHTGRVMIIDHVTLVALGEYGKSADQG